MDNIKEVRYFECTCSRCGKVVQNKHGLADLKIAGWKKVSDKIFCPECFKPYADLSPKVGDIVGCLVADDKWGKIVFGRIYRVCQLVKNEPGTIYIDVGDGWQRKLVRGEYHLF